MENRKFKYDFFISYKHGKRDSKISGYLQKKLEGYKIPREIKKRCGKEKITRVFRDKEELSVTVDLSLEIEEQLKNTEYLIVMCSPQSKQSQWVNREVETFLKYRGWEYVLPVLIEGEPRDSFPEILNQREMLAADVRGENFAQVKKKCKHEILRLIAPALGCSYDELRQRNRAYVSRRIAASAIGLAAVAAGFGAYAWNQSVKIQENYWQKMKSQAGLLAEKAEELLDGGDRDAALLVALEALPESSASEEKPFEGKAQIALEQALYLYEQNSVTAPRPSHTLKMDNSMKMVYALNEERDVLISCDEKNIIYVWDLQDGSLKYKYMELHQANENCEALLAGEGTQIFICTYSRVICFDYEKQQVLWEILASEYSEDGYGSWHKYVISPEKDMLALLYSGKVWVVSTENGELLHYYPLQSVEWSSGCAVWNPNGKQLALADGGLLVDGYVMLLDLADGRETILKTFDDWDWGMVEISYKSEDRLTCVSADMDDYSLGYTYAYAEYYVEELDCNAGETVWEIKKPTVFRDSGPDIRYICQEENGETYDLTLVTMGSEVIAIREGELWAEFAYDSRIVGHVPYGLFEMHTSEKGINYLVNWGDRYILNERYDTIELGLEDIYIAEGIRNNGIVAFPGFGGGVLYVYEPVKDEAYAELENSGEATYIDYSPDHKYRISKTSREDDSRDGILNVWDLEKQEHIFRQEFFYDYETEEGDWLQEFGFLNEQFFYYTTYFKMAIVDVETLETVAEYEHAWNELDYMNRIAEICAVAGESPGIFFTDNLGSLYFFSMLTNECEEVIGQDKRKELYDTYFGEVYGLYFTANPVGTHVLLTHSPLDLEGNESTILIWDVKAREVVSTFEMPYTTYSGFQVSFSKDGQQMLFQNKEEGLQIMDLTDYQVQKIPIEGENHQDIWFSDDSRFVFAYTYDYFLRVYDRVAKRQTMNLECEAANLKTRYFDGENLHISVTYTMSQPVMFSYRETEPGVYECFSKIGNCELIANGTVFVRPGSNYNLYCYPWRGLDEMIAMAREILDGRELTEIERQRYSIDE